MVVPRASRAAAVRRLVVVLAFVTAAGVGFAASGLGVPDPGAKAVPRADCGPGSLPETSIQGRVPQADYMSGRAAKGYRCNTQLVSHQGTSGGFKTLRYTDRRGNTCAYYDSTLLVGRDVINNLLTGEPLGIVVLDMNNPKRPRMTDTLVSPTMLSPHESLLVHQGRGLLMAEMGTAATLPGVFEIYDVKNDCRHPERLATSLSSLFGHESGLSRDGRTYYASGTAAGLAAIDISDPRRPRTIYHDGNVQYHGLRLSDDGRTMYAAHVGELSGGGLTGAGLRILDVSDIQERRSNPEIKILSDLRWKNASIPQVAEPFTQGGHDYVLEVDEYVDLFSVRGLSDIDSAPVGAARIINVDDPKHPRVVSNIRLAVHQPDVHSGKQMQDPGAWFPAQGYAAHYCSLPRRDDPKIAACSMILSGLRVFDISDVRHPREVAYFNKPVVASKKLTLFGNGAYAMSQPAWDIKRRSIWYTDTNSGFYVVRLTNGVQSLLGR